MRFLRLVVVASMLCVASGSAYAQSTVTVSVSAFASLYGDPSSIPPVPVPLAVLAGQQLQISAPGCVISYGTNCEDADGNPRLDPFQTFRGLQIYALIGQWSTSPTVLTVASGRFFVGSFAILAAPSSMPGPFYLFLAVNDGGFFDNAGAFTVTAMLLGSDSDGDGVPDSVDQCPGTPPGEPVDSNGCSASQRDSDGDGVTDDKDQCPNTPPGTPVDATGCPLAPQLTITTTSLPIIVAGNAYDSVLSASGGQLPYTWSVAGRSGVLLPYTFFPANVSFDSATGSISSSAVTRVTAGTYLLTFFVTDSTGAVASADLNLTVSCGDATLDDVNAEYVFFGVQDVMRRISGAPACQDFTSSAHSATFTFNQLSPGSAWALIRSPLVGPASTGLGADAWAAYYRGAGGARTTSGAYRRPSSNLAVGGTATTSRHMWGDAIDFDNATCTLSEFTAMFFAAGQQFAKASYREPKALIVKMNQVCAPGVPDHAHADWKLVAGPFQQ